MRHGLFAAASHRPRIHRSLFAAPSHPPRIHRSLSAAPSHPPRIHRSLFAAPYHRPPMHRSLSAAPSQPPRIHRSLFAAHYYYPLMNCSLFAAPYHRPRMHCSLFVASCQPPLILCSLFAPLCSRTLTFPIDHDTHPLRHGRILSNQSYPSPSLMVSTHLSYVQLRPRHPCYRPFVIPLYNPSLYVSRVQCSFPVFSFFSPIHSFVYPSLSQSLQSFFASFGDRL